MLDLLSSIGEAIASGFTFLWNLLMSLKFLFQQIPTFLTFLSGTVTQLPTIYLPFAMVFITISAVLFVLGRNNNG